MQLKATEEFLPVVAPIGFNSIRKDHNTNTI